MEDYDDWLVNNKTWKKWTNIGDGESLSYAGINFHKPIDEERLVKEIKRRKKLNDMKLNNNRKQAAQKKKHRISRSVETSGK
jgi:ribosomal protein S21